MLLMLSFTVVLLNGGSLVNYELPSKYGGPFIQDPYAAAFGKDSTMGIVDRSSSLILLWNSDGSFRDSFGKEGEGPGELVNPVNLEIGFGRIWVWDRRMRMSIFDNYGNFQTSFSLTNVSVEPVSLLALNSKEILFSYEKMIGPNEVKRFFSIYSNKGEFIREVFVYKNDMYLKPIKSGNNTTIKAFGPGAHMQYYNDAIYLGFGQVPELNVLDLDGQLLKTLNFSIPTSKPSDVEIELVKRMSFPMPTGERVVLFDVPNLNINFSHEKAYFTKFLLDEKYIVFFTSPIGGLMMLGTGHSYQTYHIFDRKTKALIHSDSISLSEDGRLFISDGRIVKVLSEEDSGFHIQAMFAKDLLKNMHNGNE